MDRHHFERSWINEKTLCVQHSSSLFSKRLHCHRIDISCSSPRHLFFLCITFYSDMEDSYCLISSNVQWRWPISFTAHPERIWLTVALLLRALPSRRSVLDVDWNLARTSSPDSSGILECLACTPIQLPWFGPVRKNPISNAFHLNCFFLFFVFVFVFPVRLAGVSHHVLILALYRKADASLKKPIVCTYLCAITYCVPSPFLFSPHQKGKQFQKRQSTVCYCLC